MKKFSFLILCYLLISSASACSCMPYNTNFYQNVSQYSANGVVRLDSTYSIPLGNRLQPMARFKLIKSFNFTDKVDGDDILMFGSNGVNCAYGFSQFNIGDTLVVALGKSNGQYFIPNFDYACGVHYIKLTNGKHNGLTISAIQQLISQTITGIAKPDHFALTIYPNPVTEMIRFSSALPPNSVISIYNSNGKLVYKGFLPNSEKEIHNIDFAPGLYFLKIQSKIINKTIRFIKAE